MDIEDIVLSNYYTFDEYKRLVDKYKTIDPRELNFQNRVIVPVIEKILVNSKNISVVDVSTQYQNKETKKHTRKYYAWKHTPDLLVVKDWNYNNIDKPKEDYIAVVEIKSVFDPITRDNEHTSEEISEYREKCDKVILTDCYTWRFYKKGEEPKEFKLYDYDEEKWIMRKKDCPEFIISELGFPSSHEESIVWNELLSHLQDFLCPLEQ